MSKTLALRNSFFELDNLLTGQTIRDFVDCRVQPVPADVALVQPAAQGLTKCLTAGRSIDLARV